MPASLRFLGAAGNVTGSRYLLDTGAARLLIDCGMFQERPLLARNWQPLAADELDAVLLTHAHLDHCGLLPRLVRGGFDGHIYCTGATAAIAGLVLADAGRLQEEDAGHKRRRHRQERRRGRFPETPLYTAADAEAVRPRLAPVPYGWPLSLPGGVAATFHDAGHILGSAALLVEYGAGGGRRRLLFSGDVGRFGKPILRDPTVFSAADYVVIESTYGDRRHGPAEAIAAALAEAVNRAHQAGGNLLIPAFAIGRTQELLYHLNKLLRDDRIPHLTIFVDSPLAAEVTRVFERHQQLFDDDMRALVRAEASLFDLPNVVYSSGVEQSKAINHIRGSVIIIAGSGMCTGGRIKHHLAHNIERPESTVLFVGYQAAGTLGGLIAAGAASVRIHGREYAVRARVAQLAGLSAHADRDELYHWLSALERPPQRVFVTHGEPQAAEAFAGLVAGRAGGPVAVPALDDTTELD